MKESMSADEQATERFHKNQPQTGSKREPFSWLCWRQLLGGGTANQDRRLVLGAWLGKDPDWQVAEAVTGGATLRRCCFLTLT